MTESLWGAQREIISGKTFQRRKRACQTRLAPLVSSVCHYLPVLTHVCEVDTRQRGVKTGRHKFTSEQWFPCRCFITKYSEFLCTSCHDTVEACFPAQCCERAVLTGKSIKKCHSWCSRATNRSQMQRLKHWASAAHDREDQMASRAERQGGLWCVQQKKSIHHFLLVRWWVVEWDRGGWRGCRWNVTS